jgi:hypothetical protein
MIGYGDDVGLNLTRYLGPPYDPDRMVWIAPESLATPDDVLAHL